MRPSVSMKALLPAILIAGSAYGFQDAGGAPPPNREPAPPSSLAPELPTTAIPRGRPRPNETIIDATPLPRDKAPQLEYDQQTANFEIGQTLTGETSGATGRILADEDRGRDGNLTLTGVEGEFVEGERIFDEQGGSAIAAGPLREGVWIFNFAFKPLRTRRVDLPDVGRRTVLYLYYRVVNRTGKPRMFVPQFFLETDTGKRYPDRVVPQAVRVIEAREHSRPGLIGVPVLGAVSSTGMIPLSQEDTVDQAVHGVAVWVVDPEIAGSDSLTVFVQGLSDGFRVVEDNSEGAEKVEYKTLRIDFAMPGDAIELREREIRLMDPPYEWIYD